MSANDRSTTHRLDYDRLAPEYARHRGVHSGLLERLLTVPGLTAAHRPIEVGCGTGNYILALREQAGCAIIGVDPSAAMLARSRGRSADATVVQSRAESLPLAAGSADLIFSVDVIHHVVDRAAWFSEAARVLRPGGWLCTATDSADDIRRRQPLSSYFPETVPVELARYPAIETLRQEMAEAGFERIEEEQVERTYPLTDFTPYRERAFSSLHLISDDALERGLARMETDLRQGPLAAVSLYTLLWGRR